MPRKYTNIKRPGEAKGVAAAIRFVMWGIALFMLGCFSQIVVLPVTSIAACEIADLAKPVIILDAGHSPQKPGAMSIRGIFEVDYNDQLTQIIGNELTHSGFRVILTRKPGQEIDLNGRVDEANAHDAIALLSIHHDSAQLSHLQRVQRNGKNVYQTREPIRGFSLFVSRLNPKYEESLALARLLGNALLRLGRKPSLHHAEPIPGENRPLIDEQLGIYQFDDLIICKKPNLPAVLLEFGVLVDENDEAYVSNEIHRDECAQAIREALLSFAAAVDRQNKPQ
jgi:N-acetylmuramoyl-L-alanine amidase